MFSPVFLICFPNDYTFVLVYCVHVFLYIPIHKIGVSLTYPSLRAWTAEATATEITTWGQTTILFISPRWGQKRSYYYFFYYCYYYYCKRNSTCGVFEV